MTNFTPGPWLFRKVPEDMPPVEFWVDGPSATPIADIKVNGHTEANARLIATSPDLLTALDELMGQLTGVGIAIEGEDSGQWHGAEGLSFKQARAAISKATA